MKKLAMAISLMILFFMMVVPAVMARTFRLGDTIGHGDYVKLTAYNDRDMAGIMTYAVSHTGPYDSNVAFYYDTFCIQDNVYTWTGAWFPVAGLSNNVGLLGPQKDGYGQLNLEVDYLFYRFASGAYNQYFYGSDIESDKSNQADFQKLLWSLQGSGSHYNSIGTPWASDLDKKYYETQSLWGTSVINIVSGDGTYDIQNQLFNPDPPSVPEPATMLLLGLGLMGIAGIRRKL
jgi:hypothetical protein